MQWVGERGKWLWNSSKENLIASICKQEMQLNRFSLKKIIHATKIILHYGFKLLIYCIKELLLLLYTSRNHDMVLLLEIKLFVMTFFSALWLPRERRFCFIGHCSLWDKGPGPHLVRSINPVSEFVQKKLSISKPRSQGQNSRSLPWQWSRSHWRRSRPGAAQGAQ